MLGGMLDRLSEQGFAARAGLAGTPGAAWAAARFAPRSSTGWTILQDGEERLFLHDLPLAALLDRRAQPRISCRASDCETVGMVASAPRAPLARRFGASLLLRPRPGFRRGRRNRVAATAVPSFSVERHLAEPIGLVEDIERLARLLAVSLKSDSRGAARARGFSNCCSSGGWRRHPHPGTRFASAAGARPDMPSLSQRLAALGAVLDPGYGFELVRLVLSKRRRSCRADRSRRAGRWQG